MAFTAEYAGLDPIIFRWTCICPRHSSAHVPRSPLHGATSPPLLAGQGFIRHAYTRQLTLVTHCRSIIELLQIAPPIVVAYMTVTAEAADVVYMQ
jgi:hypothetical protein